MDLQIEHIGGYCPVQAEGSVNGMQFYFRARHKQWQFSVGDDPVGAMLGCSEGFVRRGPYEKAGYMPEQDALDIIRRCAQEYVEQQDVANF